MFHWQFHITYFFSVPLKFWACYIAVQWGDFKVKNVTLCLHILSWHSFLVFSPKNCFCNFHFFFGDEASHFQNTVLTNQKIEWVIRNFHCKCMCNSAVNNIRWVSLPNCQLPRVYLVSSMSNPTDGLNRIFGPSLVTRLQIMCPSAWVTTKPLFW